MASKQQKEDEKHEKIIRGLLKLPGNRKCINCGSLGPQYVCTNFSTFICTLCSGIHREFSHRIKSISMAKFTAAEIAELQSGGNDRAREIFFKDWNSNRNIYPDSSNPDRIREFIKAVYEQRRFTAEKASLETTHDRSTSTYKSPEDRNMRNGNRNYIKNVPNQNDGSRYDKNSHSNRRAEEVRGHGGKSSPEISHTTASGTKKETVLRQLLEPPVAMRRGTQIRRSISSGTRSSTTEPGPAASGSTELPTERAPAVQRSNSMSLIDLITGPETATNSQADPFVTPGPAASGSTELPTERAPAVQRSNSMSLIDLITGPETATNSEADPFVTTPDAKSSSSMVHNTTFDMLDFPLETAAGVKQNVHVTYTSTGSNWSIDQLGIAPLSQFPTAGFEQHMPATSEALSELQQLSISENFFVAPAREASMPNMQAMGFGISPQFDQELAYGDNQVPRSRNPFDLTSLPNEFPSPVAAASTHTRSSIADLSASGSVTFPTWSDTLITQQLPPYPVWDSNNYVNTLNQHTGMQMMPNSFQGTFSDMASGYSNNINAQLMYNVAVPSNPFA